MKKRGVYVLVSLILISGILIVSATLNSAHLPEDIKLFLNGNEKTFQEAIEENLLVNHPTIGPSLSTFLFSHSPEEIWIKAGNTESTLKDSITSGRLCSGGNDFPTTSYTNTISLGHYANEIGYNGGTLQSAADVGNICSQCAETCSNLGYSCGTQTVCGEQVNCGTCLTYQYCSTSAKCECESFTCPSGWTPTLFGDHCACKKNFVNPKVDGHYLIGKSSYNSGDKDFNRFCWEKCNEYSGQGLINYYPAENCPPFSTTRFGNVEMGSSGPVITAVHIDSCEWAPFTTQGYTSQIECVCLKQDMYPLGF